MAGDARGAAFQSSTPRIRAPRLLATLFAVAFLAAVPTAARAQLPIGASSGDQAAFALGTPLGAVEYFPGRGLRLGDTGLTVGAFSTFEIDREEGGTGVFELDSINLMVLFEPFDFFRAFAEIEFDEIFSVAANDDNVHSDPGVVVERLYGDFSYGDALQFRLGKFQTPVGRFNLVPAEPFIWTANDPVVFETAFDEHQTGGALFGTLFGESLVFNYWVYGQFFDSLDVESDEEPADLSVGSRVTAGDVLGTWSVGASFLGSEDEGSWSYLGGVDGLLHVGPLELTSEFLFQRGDLPDRDLWDVFVQGVYDLGPLCRYLRGLHVVGRYEHIDPHGSGEDANLWDVGLAWIPVPYLNLKATYRFADRETEEVGRGLNASISVLF